MDAKTLKALKESIQKWEEIIAGRGIDEQGKNCPLCSLFWNDKSKMKHCLLCPIFLNTGKKYCWDTPYSDWADHQDQYHHMQEFNKYIICPTCRRLAKAELVFLKSLLPKGKP